MLPCDCAISPAPLTSVKLPKLTLTFELAVSKIPVLALLVPLRVMPAGFKIATPLGSAIKLVAVVTFVKTEPALMFDEVLRPRLERVVAIPPTCNPTPV